MMILQLGSCQISIKSRIGKTVIFMPLIMTVSSTAACNTELFCSVTIGNKSYTLADIHYDAAWVMLPPPAPPPLQ